MTIKNIVIFGLGETAHLAYEYFTHDPAYADYEVVAFCADREYIKEDCFLDLPVVSTDDVITRLSPNEHCAFAAAGSGKLNRARERLYNKAKSLGYKMVSYVSSRAFVWHNVEIGENCFILEDNTLQPFTKIGNNVVLWSGNHIGHRSEIEDHCFITSHVVVSGFCKIGAYSFVGVNAAFTDGITVGQDNFIGMGTIVNKNTQPDEFYSGAPMNLRKVSATKFCKVDS